MFGYRQFATDVKFAVTATTISDASPYLFSNYNGIGKRQKNCGKTTAFLFPRTDDLILIGYKHVRPWRIEDEPFVWEA